MSNETEICRQLSALLPRGRQNDCFESDAEIIDSPGRKLLFTTDEFSAEDHFREDDPYLLGWNIAAGAISDIYACGGRPHYYAHALTVSPEWDEAWLEQFGLGVRAVLLETGAGFIGGDCGRAEHWRCTASVLGACAGRPVTRRGAEPGDRLFLSGPIGAGNLEAAGRLAGTFPPRRLRLPVRRKEARLVQKFASACIDTSDGLCSALNHLADLNGVGYSIRDLPYEPAAIDFCHAAGLDPRLLFLGECGEYELLLSVKPARERAFLQAVRRARCGFIRLGEITENGRQLTEESEILDLSGQTPSARDYATTGDYVKALLEHLRHANKGVSRHERPTGRSAELHSALRVRPPKAESNSALRLAQKQTR